MRFVKPIYESHDFGIVRLGRTLSGVRAAVVAILLAGCGRWNFDATTEGGDAAPTDTGDAGGDGCTPTAPFGMPVPITELNGNTPDGTLRLSPDELTGYYWSRKTGNSRVYYVTRTGREQPFTVMPVTGLSTMDNDLDPMLATDGSVMVFRHNTPGDELWTARKVDAITFASPLPMTNINLPSVEQQPYVLGAAEALVFSSDRNGANFDLWLSTRSGASFGTPVRLLELNLGGSAEGDPVLSSDGLTIYFRSNRAGGPGQFDIYVATRSTTASAFGSPVLVPNISSSVDDGPSWISPDGCRLYLSSDRDGTNDIFVSTRGS